MCALTIIDFLCVTVYSYTMRIPNEQKGKTSRKSDPQSQRPSLLRIRNTSQTIRLAIRPPNRQSSNLVFADKKQTFNSTISKWESKRLSSETILGAA